MERPTEWAIERSLPYGRAAFHSAYRVTICSGLDAWILRIYLLTHFHVLKVLKKSKTHSFLKINDVLKINPFYKSHVHKRMTVAF